MRFIVPSSCSSIVTSSNLPDLFLMRDERRKLLFSVGRFSRQIAHTSIQVLFFFNTRTRHVRGKEWNIYCDYVRSILCLIRESSDSKVKIIDGLYKENFFAENNLLSSFSTDSTTSSDEKEINKKNMFYSS